MLTSNPREVKSMRGSQLRHLSIYARSVSSLGLKRTKMQMLAQLLRYKTLCSKLLKLWKSRFLGMYLFIKHMNSRRLLNSGFASLFKLDRMPSEFDFKWFRISFLNNLTTQGSLNTIQTLLTRLWLNDSWSPMNSFTYNSMRISTAKTHWNLQPNWEK